MVASTFAKSRENFQTRIMFENYSFFHYCLLSCRYVMLKKSILSKPKWGAHAVVRGVWRPGPTVATTLATSTKSDTPVANFVNSRQKNNKAILWTRAWNSNLNSKKLVVLPNSKKQRVNKTKPIKSKTRLRIFISLNSTNLIFLPNLKSKKLNWFLVFDWVKI